MSYDYDAACKTAADEQGITKIVDQLKDRGVVAEVLQTGGFCMVAVVDLGEGWFVSTTDESGAGLWRNEEDFYNADMAGVVADCGDDKADEIAAFVKQWREGIAKMRATRKHVDDMTVAIPELVSNVDPFAGFLYFGAYWVCECADGTYSVDVANDGMRGSLAECEAYLYGYCVRMNER
jgi:hypothetical protein